jgi:N-acetylglutamate synthase-like GNAT family acetyltransferase
MPKVIEFQPQYTEEVKRLVDVVLESLGINADTIQLYKEADLDRIDEIYKDRGRFWIALDQGKAIGTIAIIGSDTDKDVARLRRMFVLPNSTAKA